MPKKRIEYLDYAKAFAILTVLLNHSSFKFLGINCFTMAVFFISSGFTYNSDQDSFGVCFAKKLKRLLVPFWTLMAVSIVLEAIRAPFIGYGTLRGIIPIIANMIYGSGLFPNCGRLGQLLIESSPFTYNSKYMVDVIMPTNCQAWALPVMFSGYMIFYLYRKIIKSRNIFTDIAAILVMLLFASVETIPGIFQLPYGLGRGFVCAAFMITGFWFREHKTFEDTNIIRIILLMIISAAVTVICIKLGSHAGSMVVSNYGPYGVLSVILTFLCGLCSSYVVIMICRFINQLSFKPVNAALSFVGRNTMEIFLWHFAVFFVFDASFILKARPVLSPEIYYDSLFTKGYIFYRIIRLISTVFVLSHYGEVKANRTGKF